MPLPALVDAARRYRGVTRRVSFYNPRDASPEVLEELFVGRQPLLDEILDDLARQADGPSRQHWLLRGPRGMGKTHLSGLLDHRARTDPRLVRAYLPVWLGEADVYASLLGRHVVPG